MLKLDSPKQEAISDTNVGDSGSCLDSDDYDYISPEMLLSLREEAKANGTSEAMINHLYPLS